MPTEHFYVICDRRDNHFFSGLTGWSKLEKNAIWYNKKEADQMLATLNREAEGRLYLVLVAGNKIFAPQFNKQTRCWVVRIENINGNISMFAFDTPSEADTYYKSEVKRLTEEA